MNEELQRVILKKKKKEVAALHFVSVRPWGSSPGFSLVSGCDLIWCRRSVSEKLAGIHDKLTLTSALSALNCT